ncbi:hypothetical protein [Haemophilus parahaemolyticus]|jgi:hypothetical protein|uniref:hypothetical protein n=1 Tax=Haemophilus parahaemolyticus TaxID=735 RepID=UPI0028E2CA9E|nr:hypothetical protein [Haemophilus parahaemolyticus]
MAIELSSIINPITSMLRGVFNKNQQASVCQQALRPLEQLIERIPTSTLREYLFYYFEENVGFFQKSEIMRGISLIKNYLMETVKNHSFSIRYLGLPEENAVLFLKERLPNEWLWILALYLERCNEYEFIQKVIKYNILENILPLNEISANEMAMMNEEQFDYFD